jgi:hypothetical protein
MARFSATGLPSPQEGVVSPYGPRPTEEDIRLHAWLNKRLMILHRERRGLWARLGRFLRN